ncbi:transcriptional regulator [Ureibacillus sp. Re31]|uniref:Transcriptional regulator n=1 Tax=Ureibacillus galli TaxID=2762222 RepID=A0ABR8XAQ1_9BACL|nr:transcriptional regulator [Ureibacillus galli]MBD8026403.1 transcriptional regulator [Ureibacillus galli]
MQQGVVSVKELLLKVMQRNQLVDMMYIAKNGEITKRRIKVIKVSEDKFNAYCFLKHANRLFCIDNVLALLPVIRKEREVI